MRTADTPGGRIFDIVGSKLLVVIQPKFGIVYLKVPSSSFSDLNSSASLSSR